MRFDKTLVVNGLTWIYFTGTVDEVERARQWCDKNKTMWVIYSANEPTKAGTPLGIQNRVNFAKGLTTAEVQTKFAFKSPSDALRFKLSAI